MYHDPVEHNVYISEDEGSHWELIPNVPQGEAHILIEHPYNNRIVRPKFTSLGCIRLSVVHLVLLGLCPFSRRETLANNGSWQTLADIRNAC